MRLRRRGVVSIIVEPTKSHDHISVCERAAAYDLTSEKGRGETGVETDSARYAARMLNRMVGPLKSVYQHALVRFRLAPLKASPKYTPEWMSPKGSSSVVKVDQSYSQQFECRGPWLDAC